MFTLLVISFLVHVMGLLDFLLPSQFEHVKIPKVFQSNVANAASLADVSALSGASVVLDRDLNSIQIQSSDPDKMTEAVKIIKSKIAEAEKLMFVIQLDKDEAWLIPAIIGKGGSQIKALGTDTGCRIDVSKQESTVTVIGDNKISVAKARQSLDAVIDKARREFVFVELPSEAISAFLGKGGSHIKEFSNEHGVEVERLRREPSKWKITGSEDSVLAAHIAVQEWINAWKQNHTDISIRLEARFIPAVIGNKGSVINAIQKESGCRIDVDRDSSMLTVRGSTEDKRKEVIQKINDIIAENEALESARDEKKKERDAEESLKKPKAEKSEPVAVLPAESSSPDSRKDRAAEFAATPVGLSNSGSASKSKNSGNRKKSKPKTPLAGTPAGQDLFSLLVSSTTPDIADDETAPSRVLLTSFEGGDSSSEMSSADNPAESGTSYYRSASGFTVRV